MKEMTDDVRKSVRECQDHHQSIRVTFLESATCLVRVATARIALLRADTIKDICVRQTALTFF